MDDWAMALLPIETALCKYSNIKMKANITKESKDTITRMISYQNLSSTTLFNFTDTFDHLVSNLKNGFYCGEIYEKLPIKNIVSGYRVPMVRFCDIPLGQINEHLEWYGNFSIGIKRDYAREVHGINPVWYLHPDNLILRKL